MKQAFFILFAFGTAGFGLLVLVLAIRQFWNARGVPGKIAKLRRTGVLPAEGGSDADIIRLANENRRREAAFLHVALHGGGIVGAKRLVGDGGHTWPLLCCILTEVSCALLAAFSEPEKTASIITFGSCAVVFFVVYQTERKRIAKVRQDLSRGVLPTGDAASCR